MSITVEFIENYPPYNSGDRAGFSQEEVDELVEKRIAKPVKDKARSKPGMNKMVEGSVDKSDLKESEDEDGDSESNKENNNQKDKVINIEQYHTGSGWYDVPGAPKSLRKKDAIKFLKNNKE